MGSVAAGFAVVGLVANVPQLNISIAGRLAPAERRGSSITVLVSALTIGIFGGRVAAGLLTGPLGWRGVSWVFAGVALITAPVVRSVLPTHVEPVHRRSYARTLTATVRRLGSSGPLRAAAAMQFFAFAVFNSFWTSVVLHLTSHRFGWSIAQAGLFGLVGVAAAGLPLLLDRTLAGWSAGRTSGWAVTLLVLATASVLIDENELWLFGVSVLILTASVQVLQASNQHRAITANPDGAAQANTVFMVFAFLGGSLGATLGPTGFAHGGMTAVAEQDLLFLAALGMTWLVVHRRISHRALRPTPAAH